MKHASPIRIAFMVDAFPSLSTTFILNQITGMIDRGCEVDIYSLFRSADRNIHADVKKYHLLEKVVYFDVPRNRLKRVVYAVILIVTNFHRDPKKIIRSLNLLKYRNLPGILFLTHIFALVAFLNKQYDIIHCQFGTDGSIGIALKRMGVKSKIVTSFRGYDIRMGSEKGGDIFKDIYEFGNCILPISINTSKMLLSFGTDPNKLLVHPDGIDLCKFSFKQKSLRKIPLSKITLITVARLVEEKGLQYAIQAVHKVLKKDSQLSLKYRIIGAGPLDSSLKNLVNQLDLNDHIHFLGPLNQAEVIKSLHAADIFILPSIAEILGNAMIEAQATGLPALVTAVGELPNIVIDGKSGFVVPPGDADALADKLEYLIAHHELWPEMGRIGRRIVEKNFDINRLNDRLIRIFNEVIEGNIGKNSDDRAQNVSSS